MSFCWGVLVTEVCTMSLLGDADDWRMYYESFGFPGANKTNNSNTIAVVLFWLSKSFLNKTKNQKTNISDQLRKTRTQQKNVVLWFVWFF